MATDVDQEKVAALTSCVAAGVVCILSAFSGTYRLWKRKKYHLKRSFAKDKKHSKGSDAIANDNGALELTSPDAERPAIKQETKTLHKPTIDHNRAPAITLTTPDTRNNVEFISQSLAHNRTTDEYGNERQGLVVPPKLSKKRGFLHDWSVVTPSPEKNKCGEMYVRSVPPGLPKTPQLQAAMLGEDQDVDKLRREDLAPWETCEQQAKGVVDKMQILEEIVTPASVLRLSRA